MEKLCKSIYKFFASGLLAEDLWSIRSDLNKNQRPEFNNYGIVCFSVVNYDFFLLFSKEEDWMRLHSLE
jgi:hypothetical protein